MPVTVTYAFTTATITTAAGPVQVATSDEGWWTIRHADHHVQAPSLPWLQSDVDRIDRNTWHTPDPSVTLTVPALLDRGAGRWEAITVLGHSVSDGHLEVARANGLRDSVPAERVWNPMDEEQRVECLAVHAARNAARDRLTTCKATAATVHQTHGAVTVHYDHAEHLWTATATHDGNTYGPFTEQHASDAAHQARIALYCVQFPWTVEPTGTGVNLAVMVVPTERIASSEQAYPTREAADRHVAAHRAYRVALRAVLEFRDVHKFQADAHFPPRPEGTP